VPNTCRSWSCRSVPRNRPPSGGELGLPTREALRVVAPQHLRRLTGPLGDLGRRDARVQPRRHGGVAQVVGCLGQRRGELLHAAALMGAECADRIPVLESLADAPRGRPSTDLVQVGRRGLRPVFRWRGFDALLAAEHDVPEEVRYRPWAQQLTRDLSPHEVPCLGGQSDKGVVGDVALGKKDVLLD
jgi:hypothetical protein